jgi:hypothetical protein
VVLTAALIGLDLLPLYALLLVAAGFAAGDIGRPALPFTYLAAASATFTLTGRLLRRLPVVASIAAGILVGFGLLIVAIAVSPAAYGDMPGGLLGGAWAERLVSDLATDSSPINSFLTLGVLVLILVLGFRGVALGRDTPDIDSVLNLLKVSLGAIVFAALLATALPAGGRLQAEATLGVLLPLDVFAGLLASALSRAALNREELAGADPHTAGGERWLAMAIVLAGFVVVVTIAVSSIVTFGSLTAALRQLGPVGAALDTAVNSVIEGFAWLLFFLLGPLIDLLQHVRSQAPAATPTPTPQGQLIRATPGATQTSRLADQWVHLAEIFLIVCAVLLLVLISIAVLRLLLGARRPREDAGIDEEREALDGASLLQAQLRGLLDRFRRRPDGEAEEPLPQGSVRALYRELLRMAASRGIGRRPPETPDEYGRRLGKTLSAIGGANATPGDLTTLSEAYDAARYGEREPADGDQRTLRERAKRVMQVLRRSAG